VDETLRSNRTTQEEKERANRESERLREEANQIRRDANAATAAAKAEAAAGKQSDHEKTVVKHTKEYGLQLEKEKIPQLDILLSDVEKNLEGYKNPDGTYQNIPGLGLGGNLRPEATLDDKALTMRRAVVPLRRLITTSEAGLSQTAAEMKGVLEQLGVGAWSTDESFIKAIPHLRTILNSRKNTVASSFEPEAISTFHKRAKTANPLGDAPVQVRSKADYDKLPSGTVFIPEDGSAPRTKP
jgi:excinuclease UvrABC ATPase subunit